jgi:large subunit ribosomal protein L10
MTREEKANIIEELKEKFTSNSFFYITDGGGMTVAQVNDFRRLCFQKGIEYRVIKNTLIKKALESVEGDFAPLNEKALTGFSGVLFHKENAKAPANLLKEFYKTGLQKPVLKAASIDAELYIGSEQLDALTKLRSKQDLIGEVITLLQSPAKNVIGGLQNSGAKLAGILKTLSEREETTQA